MALAQQGKPYLGYLGKAILINDRPFDVAIQNTFRVSLPNGFDGANQGPELIQFAPHPSHSTRSSDLFIKFFQRCTQCFLFWSD